MRRIFISIALSGIALVGYAFAAEPAQFDFGDASDPGYPTLLQNNGARHKDISRAWLGGAVDAEADARLTDADLNDDGLVGADPLAVRVTAAPLPAVRRAWYLRVVDFFTGRGRNRPYYINVLIDRDNNGSWQSPAEWTVQNHRVQVPAGSSAEVLLKDASGNDVRWDRTSEGWMRITLTDARIRNYDGTTRNPFQVGETEDYAPEVPPTKEPRRAIWCFVDEKVCRTLTNEESDEARDTKVELKGPYPDNASCVADCAKRTIETPTPVPNPRFPLEIPQKPTSIPTISPATPGGDTSGFCAAFRNFTCAGNDPGDPRTLRPGTEGNTLYFKNPNSENSDQAYWTPAPLSTCGNSAPPGERANDACMYGCGDFMGRNPGSNVYEGRVTAAPTASCGACFYGDEESLNACRVRQPKYLPVPVNAQSQYFTGS